MNRLLPTLTALLLTTASQAQLSGNGYYRIQNVATQRYARVVDDYGKINYTSTSADMGALKTIKGFDNVVCDPASVVFIEKKGSNAYDLRSQGTGLYDIIQHYIRIRDNGNGTYQAYAYQLGNTIYLNDEVSRRDDGVISNNDVTSRDWYITPVTQADNQYFGIQPTVSAGNYHYRPFYAEFAFSAATAANTRVCYVSQIDASRGVAVYKEVVGSVPAATPVFVRCASDSPDDNKLNLLTTAQAAISDNLLTGVYFCNTNAGPLHTDVVDYNAATMRVLGTNADGQLAMVTATGLDYIPANSCYLSVAAGTPAELRLVSEMEYKQMTDDVTPGDSNGDGKINITDIAAVIDQINHPNNDDPLDIVFGDVNGDGKVNVTDIAAIIDLIMNPPADVLKGDANSDGKVNITDVAATIDYIMGRQSANFNFDAADVNGDKKVNVTDVAAIIDIIMQ